MVSNGIKQSKYSDIKGAVKLTNKRLYELAIAGLNAEMETIERKIATAKGRIDNGESHFREVLTKLQDERERIIPLENGIVRSRM